MMTDGAASGAPLEQGLVGISSTGTHGLDGVGETDTIGPCSICLEPMNPLAVRNRACLTLQCSHVFHAECVCAYARSESHNHGCCPLCRQRDPHHQSPPSSTRDNDVGLLFGSPPESTPESSQALLDRAIAMAADGSGSAVLRRQCRTLNKLREEKYLAIAAAASFKTTHAKVMKQYYALRLARKRSTARHLNAKRLLIAHMRHGNLD
jgi:hypothetical protein